MTSGVRERLIEDDAEVSALGDGWNRERRVGLGVGVSRSREGGGDVSRDEEVHVNHRGRVCLSPPPVPWCLAYIICMAAGPGGTESVPRADS